MENESPTKQPRERKYEWNPKWAKDKNYNCTTCKWLGQQGMVGSFGEHWGCYFNDSWQRWIPQRLAKRKTVCTVPEERRKFRDANVHWDPVDGFKPKPVKPLETGTGLSSSLGPKPADERDDPSPGQTGLDHFHGS